MCRRKEFSGLFSLLLPRTSRTPSTYQRSAELKTTLSSLGRPSLPSKELEWYVTDWWKQESKKLTPKQLNPIYSLYEYEYEMCLDGFITIDLHLPLVLQIFSLSPFFPRYDLITICRPSVSLLSSEGHLGRLWSALPWFTFWINRNCHPVLFSVSFLKCFQ